MTMTEAEICREYSQAANPAAQIGILADLNVTTKQEIISVLERNGMTFPQDARRERKGGGFVKKRGWDTSKAKALYDEKKTDSEIAEAVGVTRSTICAWRRGLQLPPNPPSEENHEPKAAPPPPVSPPSRPLALPAMKGPVELSVEMDGHAFALRAPDLGGAERIYEYAGHLLKDMEQAAAKLKEGIDHG